jgi:cytochrome P450
MTQSYHYPAGYSFAASIPRMLKQVKDPIGTMQESMALFQDTYTVHLGMKKYVVTQDPGLIDHVLKSNHRNYHKSPLQSERLGKFLGNGLLTSNGEYWLRQRRLIQPGFHIEKIHALYDNIAATVHRFLEHFPLGRQNIYPSMNSLAFEIVINSLFTIEVPLHLRKELGNFISETQAFIMKDIRQPYKSWWFKLSGEEQRNLDKAAGARNIIRDLIRERQQSGKKFNDLLDMLLEARYEDDGKPMQEEQIIDEILILIIAGHETTSNALSWTLYLLAHHHQMISILREEIKTLSLRDTVTNENLSSVIKESMRLYPPAWISDRISLGNDEYLSYRFPPQTIFVLFYYGLHRSAKYWTDASAFHPERFNKSNFSKDQSKYYYPFGGGPRLCIGNNFAMAEMAIFLQAFLARFEVKPTENTPKMIPLVTLKPDSIVLHVSKI